MGLWSFLLQRCLIEIPVLKANSVDPDQTPRSAASDLGLHCLQRLHSWDFIRLKWVKLQPKSKNTDRIQSLNSYFQKRDIISIVFFVENCELQVYRSFYGTPSPIWKLLVLSVDFLYSSVKLGPNRKSLVRTIQNNY